jgi:hypothetical protein
VQVAIPRSLASLLEMQYGIRPRAEIKDAGRIGVVKSASVYESVRFDLHENPAPRTHAPKHLLNACQSNSWMIKDVVQPSDGSSLGHNLSVWLKSFGVIGGSGTMRRNILFDTSNRLLQSRAYGGLADQTSLGCLSGYLSRLPSPTCARGRNWKSHH